MIKISKRLEAISSLVPINSNIIDIGCDHALLDIYLYQKKISNKIIASDINNIKKEGLSDKINIRLGSGLNPYKKDEVDTLVLAGMGTYTIIDILKNSSDKLNNVKNIIVQSNTKIELLRREIIKLDYYIDNEIMLIDKGIYYTIISFKKGKKKYTKYELYFGPILLNTRNKVFTEYFKKEYDRLFVILDNLPRNKIIERFKIKKILNMYKNI